MNAAFQLCCNLYRPALIDDTNSGANILRSVPHNPRRCIELWAQSVAPRPAAQGGGEIQFLDHDRGIRCGLDFAPRVGSLRVRRFDGLAHQLNFPAAPRGASTLPCVAMSTLLLEIDGGQGSGSASPQVGGQGNGYLHEETASSEATRTCTSGVPRSNPPGRRSSLVGKDLATNSERRISI
jgi:hypothetical protein